MRKIVFNKNTQLILYKLLNDLLFCWLIFFLLTLVAEGLLPGIITRHLSFLKIILVLILNLVAIYILGSFSSINLQPKKIEKRNFFWLTLLAIFLIFNSLIKINLILNIFILIFSLAIIYFSFKNLFED